MERYNGASSLAMIGPERYGSIIQALHATLDPRISNDVRKQALEHLEQVKLQPDAPSCGYALAEDSAHDAVVRHFGLQLLDYAVRYRWTECGSDERDHLREWTKSLAGQMSENDPLFIRSKIAQLWTNVAKRCWGDEWMDMDALLLTLWERQLDGKSMVHKVFVLYVLELLSEDIINKDDAIAGLRLDVLRNALNEIIIPPEMYHSLASTQKGEREVRSGSEGWLVRIFSFLAQCVKDLRLANDGAWAKSLSTCVTKALGALRPTVAWINVMAIVGNNGIDCLFLPFYIEDVGLCTATTEVLYGLLRRPHEQMWLEGWDESFRQALQPDRIRQIKVIFEMARSEPGEDDEKYTLQKKLSDLLSVLADTVAAHPELARPDQNIDMPSFFALLQQVLQSPSLTVSIPVLHSFTRLMNVDSTDVTDRVFEAFGVLVQTCSTRLIKYEALPEQSDNTMLQFLYQDFDTMPEQHAFLGNYRRYCLTILQSVTRTRPREALSFVLGQFKDLLTSGPYTFANGFNSENYSKNSLPVLNFDAQFQLVGGALKGYEAWSMEVANMSPTNDVFIQADTEGASIANMLRQWSYSIMETPVDDPEVAALVLETLILVLQNVRPEPSFVLSIVRHLLATSIKDNPAHQNFSEGVKAFEVLRVYELQRLAMHFSDELLEVYGELEPHIRTLLHENQGEPRQLWGYTAFLFMINHRGANLNHDVRQQRLIDILRPVSERWQDRQLADSLTSFENFCANLGVGSLPEFYRHYRFDQIAEWASTQLDDAGQAQQLNLKRRAEALPLRMTKALLSAATEKIKPGSDQYESACALWGPMIPIILPKLLQMLRYAQSFYSMATWAHLPNEMQAVIRRTLQDRFWQSGISNESKDEFYARISGSRASYEGFASSVRATMRTIREQGFHVLFLLAKFDEQFYGLSDLAAPLAVALYENADSLSPSQLQSVINISTGLVQQCPPHHRSNFLPPILINLFRKLDRKIWQEWEFIGQVNETNGQEEALGDEMRAESVLRQLTYAMVSFVTLLLQHDGSKHEANGRAGSKSSIGKLVLNDPTILEPLIVFCMHTLRVRDMRCCSATCKIFRGIIPGFTGNEEPAPQVREFISEEVLKASITSLNEPYFADVQKDLAMLIANIILYCGPKTDTPRRVLVSLPNISEVKVESMMNKIWGTPHERQQRALVLELLEGVRGVSIHEQGKMFNETKTPSKSATQQRYMIIEEPLADGNTGETGFDGIARLFYTA